MWTNFHEDCVKFRKRNPENFALQLFMVLQLSSIILNEKDINFPMFTTLILKQIKPQNLNYLQYLSDSPIKVLFASADSEFKNGSELESKKQL